MFQSIKRYNCIIIDRRFVDNHYPLKYFDDKFCRTLSKKALEDIHERT